jgi:bifunctional DNA-binding transcriptional regulator/antitoxin component of YhaV-PrlF toxin-antitoxin module
MTEYEPADERIEVECPAVNVGVNLRQALPTDIREQYDLDDTVVDIVVSQGDVSFSASDVRVDDQGRFNVPAKKANIYGLDRDGRMTVFIDRVALR